LATTAVSADAVDIIAGEISRSVERAVDRWMSEFENVLTDSTLTSLGRLNAIQEIVENYNCMTGRSRTRRQ
jgi:hypothetical protein